MSHCRGHRSWVSGLERGEQSDCDKVGVVPSSPLEIQSLWITACFEPTSNTSCLLAGECQQTFFAISHLKWSNPVFPLIPPPLLKKKKIQWKGEKNPF